MATAVAPAYPLSRVLGPSGRSQFVLSHGYFLLLSAGPPTGRILAVSNGKRAHDLFDGEMLTTSTKCRTLLTIPSMDAVSSCSTVW